MLAAMGGLTWKWGRSWESQTTHTQVEIEGSGVGREHGTHIAALGESKGQGAFEVARSVSPQVGISEQSSVRVTCYHCF